MSLISRTTLLAATLTAVFTLATGTSAAEPAKAADFPALDFEHGAAGKLPPGWRTGVNAPTGDKDASAFTDDKVFHGGAQSIRLERDDKSAGDFSAINASVPMNFAGTTIVLRGWLRTDGVDGRAGLWMREDGDTTAIAFDNMQATPLSGTTQWTEYSIQLPVDASGRTLVFGALLIGKGKVWVDDFQLLVDGKPVQTVPKIERPKTPLETDHEFDAGSKIVIDKLTPLQTASLTTLGKVWGFLKYHHPKVTGGQVHWDYELFRVMPRVLVAADTAAARQAIVDWIKTLGEIAPCDPCATVPDGLALRPDIDWIHDKAALGEPLSALLEQVYRSRPANGDQAYVKMKPEVNNPELLREPRYDTPELPDVGYRILALYRWWNVVLYWSPYRDVIGADWNAVLREFLPRLVAANDVARYRLEMFALIARLNDGHANLWGQLDARPPVGSCSLPVRVRAIEGKAIVSAYANDETGHASGLKIGDEIVGVDGTPVPRLTASWTPYYCASNDAARAAAMMNSLTQGACGPVKLTVERSGKTEPITAQRGKPTNAEQQTGFTHDLAGPAFRKLSNDVAYLKLSSFKIADVPTYLHDAEGTKGWIIDIRNYPSEFAVFALGGHFVARPTPFVRFTNGDLSNPGAFVWTKNEEIPPLAPLYSGKVVILVDEASISQAEYTAMALRSGPNATVVGSTTDGADGNVSPVPLPGGLQTLISGIGVFYPDKKPTQRIGIVSDVIVRPTVAGFRAGRDEVLEAAIKQIVPGMEEKKVREMGRR
ncbi:MAG TPA: S41 family peptidase [Candidatus Polarisedimenticolaceae bacterium]|nr:S41 family peptidase [Candidatus Polarisedimenticolaceae bacterium]